MKLFYITFRSVTFAQRGERVLTGAGIRCTMQRTPRWMEELGCGYALRVWAADVAPAVERLRAERVQLRRVYGSRDDGQLEELTV
ncbi:MAG: DUF3343 domain-containing protein [Eubacteriales bacterium]|nr:DUF3343 domain-containing protein [Eubacteriales bacterium]